MTSTPCNAGVKFHMGNGYSRRGEVVATKVNQDLTEQNGSCLGYYEKLNRFDDAWHSAAKWSVVGDQITTTAEDLQFHKWYDVFVGIWQDRNKADNALLKKSYFCRLPQLQADVRKDPGVQYAGLVFNVRGSYDFWFFGLCPDGLARLALIEEGKVNYKGSTLLPVVDSQGFARLSVYELLSAVEMQIQDPSTSDVVRRADVDLNIEADDMDELAGTAGLHCWGGNGNCFFRQVVLGTVAFPDIPKLRPPPNAATTAAPTEIDASSFSNDLDDYWPELSYGRHSRSVTKEARHHYDPGHAPHSLDFSNEATFDREIFAHMP